MAFGEMLRDWRKTRGLSQLDLALEAGISAKHVSFLETERSKPTEGMVLRLADSLHLPLREKNSLLTAAGFSRRFGQSDWQDPHVKAHKAALDLILASHAPCPAFALDQDMALVAANDGFVAFLSLLLGEEDRQAGPLNLVEALLAPGPLRDAIINWDEIACHLVSRIRSHLWICGKHQGLSALLDRALAQPGVREALDEFDPTASQAPLMEMSIRLPDGTETCWYTTITTFGTAKDTLLEEIWIEQMHPADAATRQLLQ